MELFLPSVLLFIISAAVSFVVVPRLTPLITTVLAGVFLAAGIYHHYSLFSAEYRLSTWQQGVRMFAPALLLGAVILYLLFIIFTFFTGGSVPVPSLPEGTPEAVATPLRAISNMTNRAANAVTNTANTVAKSVSTFGANAGNSFGLGNRGGNTFSRSFFNVV